MYQYAHQIVIVMVQDIAQHVLELNAKIVLITLFANITQN